MTIKFGDRELTDGPPVGDGLFVLMCGGEFYVRWLRSGYAYATEELAQAGNPGRCLGGRSNYPHHLLITPWPEPVAVDPQAERISELERQLAVMTKSRNDTLHQYSSLLDKFRNAVADFTDSPATAPKEAA